MTAGSQAAVYTVQWTETAIEYAKAAADRKTLALLHAKANGLATEPEQQGKALVGELMGLRSVRAGGQRYRILYHVKRDTRLVTVVLAGRRKAGDKSDVYTLARKLIGQGLVLRRIPIEPRREPKR